MKFIQLKQSEDIGEEPPVLNVEDIESYQSVARGKRTQILTRSRRALISDESPLSFEGRLRHITSFEVIR